MAYSNKGYLRLKTPLKINLALHILGLKANNYHLLESLVLVKQAGDIVTISAQSKKPPQSPLAGKAAGSAVIEASESLPYADFSYQRAASGPALGQDFAKDNLIVKAYQLITKRAAKIYPHKKLPKAFIALEKRIPIAAGLAGGSGDGAAVLFGLNKFWHLSFSKETLLEMASELGADVPSCLYSYFGAKALLSRDIGQDITLLRKIPSFSLIVLNNYSEVKTQQVFSKLTNKNNPPLTPLTPFNEKKQLFSYLKKTRNDLLKPALMLQPQIKQLLLALEKTKPDFSQMSGSGASCFALYSSFSHAKLSYYQLKKLYPSYYLRLLKF